MQRNWDIYKAEVERLYIDEGKPMREVRRILNRRHGLTASVLTYRLTFDEWASQKYKKKRRPSADEGFVEDPPIARIGSSSTNSESLSTPSYQAGNVQHFCQEIAIPSSPLDASDVHAFIQGHPAAPFHAFEILLTKWQRGGEYLKVLTLLLEKPEYCKWIPRPASDGRPLLFKLIGGHVPHEEQLCVGKLLLEAHLSNLDTAMPHDAQWLTAWIAACHCTEWDEANETLYRGNRVATLAGDNFLNCARAVIAEQFLRRYIQNFRSLKMQSGWLNESELLEAESCRQKYLIILEECRYADLTLRPEFYRDSLEIIEAQYPFADNRHQPRSVDLADECRHKYLQLISDSGSTVACNKDVEDGVPDLEANNSVGASIQDSSSSARYSDSPGVRQSIETVESPTTRSETWTMNSARESERSSIQLLSQDVVAQECGLPMPCAFLNTLISKWRSLKGFRTYVHGLLQEERSDISIFDSRVQCARNLFDIIHEHVPNNEQNSLTKAILVAFSTANLDLCRHPPTLVWWLTLFSASSWDEFQRKLEPEKIDEHLRPLMSPAAVQLVLNTTTLLVGERLLSGLKDEMVANPYWRATGDDMARYRDSFKQYMDILGEFRKKSLIVDQSWVSHALNAM
ncbi:uncharacterized protein BP5553_09875 [Venustampulla echinocandica]|uniref:Clr5 domain-containing protein n=1 Tax=Venustampulla echinocandica TaxID=2656787 RepID=A0A370TAX4_9HELO|nr:uncharacterized protein BP5553_09875 [Venustampulla echinocandica]RDL31086.1 hypothetical protein BP5553_09875 [Venustampulla echinocandica]